MKRALKNNSRAFANVEAEKGEQVVTNKHNDGIPENYTVGGQKHSNGGTPLNLDPQSFVFSDRASMKVKDKDILKEFGETKSKTFAEIAKKYDLNKYKKILMDKNSDEYAIDTAEQMIKNYNMKLGKLALVQESMKGFEEGIPNIAAPYMAAAGISAEDILPQQNVQGPTGGGENLQAPPVTAQPQMAYGGQPQYAQGGSFTDNEMRQAFAQRLGVLPQRPNGGSISDEDIIKMLEFEKAHGAPGGKPHPTYGINKDGKENIEYINDGDITKKDAIRYVREELLQGDNSEIYNNVPRDIAVRLMDWEYNTGRSIKDLLLTANGTITPKQLDGNVDPNLWNENKAAILEAVNNPDFVSSLDMSKNTAYQNLAKRRNAQNNYEKTWGPRTKMWNDDYSYDNWEESSYKSSNFKETNPNQDNNNLYSKENYDLTKPGNSFIAAEDFDPSKLSGNTYDSKPILVTQNGDTLEFETKDGTSIGKMNRFERNRIEGYAGTIGDGISKEDIINVANGKTSAQNLYERNGGNKNEEDEFLYIKRSGKTYKVPKKGYKKEDGSYVSPFQNEAQYLTNAISDGAAVDVTGTDEAAKYTSLVNSNDTSQTSPENVGVETAAPELSTPKAEEEVPKEKLAVKEKENKENDKSINSSKITSTSANTPTQKKIKDVKVEEKATPQYKLPEDAIVVKNKQDAYEYVGGNDKVYFKDEDGKYYQLKGYAKDDFEYENDPLLKGSNVDFSRDQAMLGYYLRNNQPLLDDIYEEAMKSIDSDVGDAKVFYDKSKIKDLGKEAFLEQYLRGNKAVLTLQAAGIDITDPKFDRGLDPVGKINALLEKAGSPERFTPEQTAMFQAMYWGGRRSADKPEFQEYKDQFGIDPIGVEDQIDRTTGNPISPVDGYFGNTTMGEATYAGKRDLDWGEMDPVKPEESPEANEFTPDGPEPWTPPYAQDVNNTIGAVMDYLSIQKDLPWSAPVDMKLANPTFYDPTRALAANAEQAAIAQQANSLFAGPQAGSARAATIQGEAFKNAANVIGDYANRNVGIANQFEMYNNQVKNQAAQLEAQRVKQDYDGTVIANQQFRNAKRAARQNIRTAYNDLLTNRAEAQTLNMLYPQYNINPWAGGTTHFTKGRELTGNASSQTSLGEDYSKFKADNPHLTENEMLKVFQMQQGQMPQQESFEEQQKRALLAARMQMGRS